MVLQCTLLLTIITIVHYNNYTTQIIVEQNAHIFTTKWQHQFPAHCAEQSATHLLPRFTIRWPFVHDFPGTSIYSHRNIVNANTICQHTNGLHKLPFCAGLLSHLIYLWDLLYRCWPFAHNVILGMQALIQYCLCTHNYYASIALKWTVYLHRSITIVHYIG